MDIKNFIISFINKKIVEKRIKINLSTKSDLFINSIFDSLDFADFSSLLDKKGYKLNMKKNNYRIPRSKSEIFKVLESKVKKEINYKKNKNSDNENIFFSKVKKLLKIKNNQNIIIHSNFSRLLNLGIKPGSFLRRLLSIKKNITVYTPSGFFRQKNRKFISLKKINPSNEFGLLSKELLKYGKNGKIYRNNNPFDNLIGYSSSGKYLKSNNSFAYGKNSPYRQLLNKDSHIMLIDVTFFYNSMFHMAELDAKVPYRKNKKFVFGKKTFNLFAREKSNLFLDYKKFEKINEIKRLKKQINFKGIKITLLDYRKLYKQSLKVLKKNPNFLLSKK